MDSGAQDDVPARRPGFPSNLKNAEWGGWPPLIPRATPVGRPGKTDMRQGMNAIFYLLRTGTP